MKKDVKETPEATQPASYGKKSTREYLEVRIPKLSFRDTPINVYLVVALVLFSFALGMLTNKVMYYEQLTKNGTTTTAQPADAQAAAAAEPTPPQVVDVAVGKLPMVGDENAKVTIVEFSDFQCPFCKSYIDETHNKLNEEYIKTGKVKFAFRHYPLTVIHPNAPAASEASECANEQGKFWEYHDVLFKNQATWSPLTTTDLKDNFVDYASEVGLNVDQFSSCYDSGKYKQNVEDDLAAGQEAQVGGTPAFFVNGYRVTGAVPYAELKRIVEQELNK